MTSSPEFDALMATTQLEREKADGIKSLVAATKLAAKYQHRAEVAEAALGRVHEAAAWLDRMLVESTKDAETGRYLGADNYADAYGFATELLHTAIEVTS